MNIAIVGPGRMGSTIGYHLARANHQVTMVGRAGARLAQLQQDAAIVTTENERVPVAVATTLDPSIAYDVVLVTLMAYQVDPVLPMLKSSGAKAIVFMFNTFEPLERLRAAVGAERASFAFPAFAAYMPEGKVKLHKLNKNYELTTCEEPRWADMLNAAGVPANVATPDMQSFLRTHAAFVIPLMVMAHEVKQRNGQGLSWAESKRITKALREGINLVKELGNAITPPMVKRMSNLPDGLTTAMMWAMSRTQATRDLAAMGHEEVQALIDQVASVGADKVPQLQSMRPR